MGALLDRDAVMPDGGGNKVADLAHALASQGDTVTWVPPDGVFANGIGQDWDPQGVVGIDPVLIGANNPVALRRQLRGMTTYQINNVYVGVTTGLSWGAVDRIHYTDFAIIVRARNVQGELPAKKTERLKQVLEQLEDYVLCHHSETPVHIIAMEESNRRRIYTHVTGFGAGANNAGVWHSPMAKALWKLTKPRPPPPPNPAPNGAVVTVGTPMEYELLKAVTRHLAQDNAGSRIRWLLGLESVSTYETHLMQVEINRDRTDVFAFQHPIRAKITGETEEQRDREQQRATAGKDALEVMLKQYQLARGWTRAGPLPLLSWSRSAMRFARDLPRRTFNAFRQLTREDAYYITAGVVVSTAVLIAVFNYTEWGIAAATMAVAARTSTTIARNAAYVAERHDGIYPLTHYLTGANSPIAFIPQALSWVVDCLAACVRARPSVAAAISTIVGFFGCVSGVVAGVASATLSVAYGVWSTLVRGGSLVNIPRVVTATVLSEILILLATHGTLTTIQHVTGILTVINALLLAELAYSHAGGYLLTRHVSALVVTPFTRVPDVGVDLDAWFHNNVLSRLPMHVKLLAMEPDRHAAVEASSKPFRFKTEFAYGTLAVLDLALYKRQSAMAARAATNDYEIPHTVVLPAVAGRPARVDARSDVAADKEKTWMDEASKESLPNNTFVRMVAPGHTYLVCSKLKISKEGLAAAVALSNEKAKKAGTTTTVDIHKEAMPMRLPYAVPTGISFEMTKADFRAMRGLGGFFQLFLGKQPADPPTVRILDYTRACIERTIVRNPGGPQHVLFKRDACPKNTPRAGYEVLTVAVGRQERVWSWSSPLARARSRLFAHISIEDATRVANRRIDAKNIVAAVMQWLTHLQAAIVSDDCSVEATVAADLLWFPLPGAAPATRTQSGISVNVHRIPWTYGWTDGLTGRPGILGEGSFAKLEDAIAYTKEAATIDRSAKVARLLVAKPLVFTPGVPPLDLTQKVIFEHCVRTVYYTFLCDVAAAMGYLLVFTTSDGDPEAHYNSGGRFRLPPPSVSANTMFHPECFPPAEYYTFGDLVNIGRYFKLPSA